MKEKRIFRNCVFGGAYIGSGIFMYRFGDMKIREEALKMNNLLIKKLAVDVSPFGLGRYQWLGWGATTALSYITGDERLQKAVVIWAGTLVLSDFVTNSVKNSVQRYRPNTGADYDTFDGIHGLRKNQSFPSAHTSNAFATATSFALVYNDSPGLVVAAYSLATIIGVSRVINNAHWSSDVMAGAAVGYLSARAVNAVYKYAGKKMIIVVPQIGQQFKGARIAFRI